MLSLIFAVIAGNFIFFTTLSVFGFIIYRFYQQHYKKRLKRNFERFFQVDQFGHTKE